VSSAGSFLGSRTGDAAARDSVRSTCVNLERMIEALRKAR
jgi:hypothetical protein